MCADLKLSKLSNLNMSQDTQYNFCPLIRTYFFIDKLRLILFFLRMTTFDLTIKKELNHFKQRDLNNKGPRTDPCGTPQEISK